MKLARGFKSYCERVVAAVRVEMGVPGDDLLDMPSLAEHLSISIHPLRSCLALSKHQRDDAKVQEIYKRVSAFTFFNGCVRFIVFNDEHAPARHRSNLAHELAHALLLHPPEASGATAAEEANNEAEAAWMAGVLMLTATQAKRIAVSGMSLLAAEKKYQLSSEMLRFRLNVTGADRLMSSTA